MDIKPIHLAVTAIVVLLVSVLLSYAVAVYVVKQGPQGTQGPKGDTGATGQQGLKGDTGATGNVPASVSAALVDDYTYYLLSADNHHVTGYAVNFGSTTAQSASISITWYLGPGSYHYQTITLDNMDGHTIQRIDVTYNFDIQGSMSYTISWS